MHVVFQPNINGMGHRIRCNTIARRIRQRQPSAKITFVLRPDDPVPADRWCDFQWVKGLVPRSKAILRADCLVHDGFWYSDFRTHLQSRRGSYLPISHPYGFPGDLTETVRCFERAARILVPWPRELFSWPDELARARSKVRLIDPVLTLPPVNSLPFPARKKVYAVVSRRRSEAKTILSRLVGRLSSRLGPVDLVWSDAFVSQEVHWRNMLESSLIVSQGTGTTFEAMALGIPRAILPLPEIDEQVRSAKSLAERGAAIHLDFWQDPDEDIAARIAPLMIDGSERRLQVESGRRLVGTEGSEKAAAAIIELMTEGVAP